MFLFNPRSKGDASSNSKFSFNPSAKAVGFRVGGWTNGKGGSNRRQGEEMATWATGNGISAFVKLGPGVFLQSTGKDRMKPNGTTVQTGRVMGGVQLMHLNGIFYVVF